ncbi:hypothetical protein DFH94DRAFT_24808 [Russula ochroleuca]|uniref:Uncharacterized protein n=1 Tax=Russula ochroleuca TaxID=152965 RepID=A0A9P5N614_9AGAM|nr:hypothetical protein DFH94DRAFT_24808 [Russula ochroleuca]
MCPGCKARNTQCPILVPCLPCHCFLIVLRVIAVWNRAKIIVATAMGILLMDVSLFIDGTIRLRSTWSPEALTCVVHNFDSTKPAVIGLLVSDIGLLLIMLIGLLRLHCEAVGSFALGRTLWRQGLIWLLFATVAEVPSAVLVILSLNASLDLITQTPTMIIVTIAATRLYRSLTNIYYSSDISHEILQGRGCAACAVSGLRVRPGPIPLNRMDVSVRAEYDQHPTPQTTCPGSYASTDPQGHYKVHEVSFNGDVESGLEK